MVKLKIWGYLRETERLAQKAGIDKETYLPRTGLNEYLNVIFPEIDDWVHDKAIGKINGKTYRLRPDYRSEKLKLIVEFDGLPHYTNPSNILADIKKNKIYEEAGYTVIRIPYFIQLTNQAVEILFNRKINFPLFPSDKSSLGISGKNTPAFLCQLGIKRMVSEFLKFPEQLEVNLNYLKRLSKQNEENKILSGYTLFKKELKRQLS